MHKATDDVGVAVQDLDAGMQVGAVTLEGQAVGSVSLVNAVPLGHKVAMHNLAKGSDVIEYGRAIGFASENVPLGSHVHTHNLKSKRWTL
jgi:(2R)-sulfolactate sulfo-lyase subunit alpha